MKPSSFQQIWHILVQDSVLYREEKAFLLDLRCQFSLLLLVSGIRCTDLVRCSAPDLALNKTKKVNIIAIKVLMLIYTSEIHKAPKAPNVKVKVFISACETSNLHSHWCFECFTDELLETYGNLFP